MTKKSSVPDDERNWRSKVFINEKGHIEFGTPLQINERLICHVKLWVDREKDAVIGEAWLERKHPF